MKSRVCIFVFFIAAMLSAGDLRAQGIIDSLQKVLSAEQQDTQRVKILNDIAWEYSYSDLDSALLYTNMAFKISEKTEYLDGLANCRNMYGIIYRSKSEFDKAIKEFNEMIEIRKRQQLLIKLIPAYTNLANVYLNMNDNVNAIAYYNKALKIAEDAKKYNYVITLINNMSVVYKNIGMYDKALSLLNRALELNKKEKNKLEEAASLSNIAVIFQEKNQYDLAIKNFLLVLNIYKDYGYKDPIAGVYSNLSVCYRHKMDLKNAIAYGQKAIDLYKEIDSGYNVALTMHNLGIVYQQIKNYKKAVDLQNEAIKICLEIGEEPCLAKCYMTKAEIYLEQAKPDSALVFAKKGLQLVLKYGFLEETSECYRTLADVYFMKNDYKNAFLTHKKFLQCRDSITSKEFASNLASVQTLYEVDKKENEIKLLTQDGIIQSEKISRQRTLTVSIVLVLILVLAFGVFSYKAFVNKKKDNVLLQHQKLQIEEKNEELNQQNEEISAQRDQIELQKQKVETHQKEIIDSITYAQRLQRAILPPKELIDRYFPENFLLYKPKDIVAGDFYWAEEINDLFFIAAADSTGHGVPGAMVSVVCSNALNRSVKEFKLTETGKILDKTRELVLETFSKSSSDVKDGMDISLLCIDKEGKKIYWSGANNPLWYVNASTGELHEIVADKQPIGKTDHAKPFTTHILSYTEGNIFYLFTDGYPDQFGGPKGKKYKYKQLENQLITHAGGKLSQQKELLDEEFENWKGDLEQVDDVTIIGIKI